MERSSDVTKAPSPVVGPRSSTFSLFAVVSPVAVAAEASDSLLNGIAVDGRAEDSSSRSAAGRRRAIFAPHSSAVATVSWRSCALVVSTICFSAWRWPED